MSRALMRALRFMRAYRLTAAAAVIAVLASTAADLVAPQILRTIIDEGIAKGDTGAIWRGSVALVAVAAAGGIASFLQGFLSAKVSHGVAFDLRNTIFDKLQQLSFSYHDRASTGQLVTRVTSDVDLVRDFVGGGLVQAVSALLLLAGAVTLLLVINVNLALVALAVIPVTIAVLLLFVKQLGPMFRDFQRRLGALNAILQENIAGARVVRAFAREEYETARYREADTALLEQGMRVRTIIANAFPLLFAVGTAGVGIVTIIGATHIIEGTLTVGELVAFTSYLFLLLQPLFILGFGAQAIARASASSERLFEVLDAPLDVAERANATDLTEVRGRVEFENACLRYPGSDTDTLSKLSFTVEPGTLVAIVGATGSGKSSVVNLVPRFYDVSSGAVRIDGHDVRDLKIASLRAAIGVVMQDSVLFSGSVRDNIAYGRPDASDAEVEAAARAAQAHDFIVALPQGYATRVGERGVRLSGGQRQRIAIARALLVDPAILIMDDSTSSVDTRTEAALRVNLEALMVGRSTFVVAQRLSTVRKADLIVLLDEGQVEAIGTHDELLATNCLYAQIASGQLLGGEAVDPPISCDLDHAELMTNDERSAGTGAGDA